jgi:hypothetical protein
MNTSRIRVASFSISLDGFGAGIEQMIKQASEPDELPINDPQHKLF